MSENTGKNVVSLLEEHVDRAISTVNKLRDEIVQHETEIARLNSEVVQRDAKIQELENNLSELKEASEFERLATEEEREGIRKQLEGLMTVLTEPDGTSKTTDDAEENSEAEVMFKATN